MTGPEHYAAAERLMAALSVDEAHHRENALLLASAQVHATLALAAATALRGDDEHGLAPLEYGPWHKVAGQSKDDEAAS